MLSNPISKKQKMNVLVVGLAYQWVKSLLPEDQEVSVLEALKQIPDEPYFFSQGQIRTNSYTFKWFRKRIKKVLKKTKQPIMSVTLHEVMNA
jgi:hypothetical protein|tara:strand:+ start:1290 stop:1565 length:276 start_codon:yes stop_codon:yes gene_type:complete